MSEPQEMAKAYEPAAHEASIYKRWEDSGYFAPEKLPGKRKTPFTIMMPPPNRTGTLHVGSATGIALQDLVIRFERMRGKKTLWLPGTDHAAIATQVKVEQMLINGGMKDPRRELGREKFIAKVVEYAEQSGKTIVMQTRKMGASCDWSRMAYTLDAPRNRAVNAMFQMMREDGLIERGFRVVNWDPQFQTTLSDDEVESKEVKARLVTFTYDKEFPIAISTTRPETKFGDTAVAVHPADARYEKFVGKTFSPVFCGKKLHITVIADKAVDPSFGTGALGVTPAHSMIDADMAERHGLTTVQVIGTDGRMLPEVGKSFAGLTVVEARTKIEAQLADDGLLKSVEEVPQNLPVAERGGAPVEQLPLKQWFVRVNKPFKLRQATLGKWKKGATATLKELMIAAVQSEQIDILPEQFKKIYFHWIDNLRDWCISRQIWYGHRIPVWYKKTVIASEAKQTHGDEMRIGTDSPGAGWEQDPDTLDTWFSSGMWTFSTLGWPEKTDDLKTFHPTDLMETGRDIIFFWVARMILMSAYALGEIPFKTVYLHGLVRDERGRKMSKSLDNIIDPVDVSNTYGTDAVRLSLVIGTTPGMDTRVGEAKIAGFRNFTNKLWNIGRYVSRLKTQDSRLKKSVADKWILSRLATVTNDVTKQLEKHAFSAAGELLREFTWNDFADWYVEIHKREGNDVVLRKVFETLLRLWHPLMPFVTETLHQELGGNDLLMVAEWPKGGKRDAKAEKEFGKFQEVVDSIRAMHASQGTSPGNVIAAVMDAGSLELALKNLRPVVDTKKERDRLKKEFTEVEKFIALIEGRIGNKDFIARAPAQVVAAEREKLAEATERRTKLKSQLAGLR